MTKTVIQDVDNKIKIQNYAHLKAIIAGEAALDKEGTAFDEDEIDRTLGNCDLSELSDDDLSNLLQDEDLRDRVDLKRLNLVNRNLSLLNLSGLDFTDVDLRGAIFSNTILRNVKFTNANLTGATLNGAIIEDCDFTNATLNDAILFNLKIIRPLNELFTDEQIRSFKDGSIYPEIIPFSAQSKTSVSIIELQKIVDGEMQYRKQNTKTLVDNEDGINVLRHLNLSDIPREELEQFLAKRKDLSRADLAGVDLAGCNLSGFDLSRTNLSGANLANAILQGAQLDDAELNSANLQGAQLQGTKIDPAKHRGADFAGATFVPTPKTKQKKTTQQLDEFTAEKGSAYAKADAGESIQKVIDQFLAEKNEGDDLEQQNEATDNSDIPPDDDQRDRVLTQNTQDDEAISSNASLPSEVKTVPENDTKHENTKTVKPEEDKSAAAEANRHAQAKQKVLDLRITDKKRSRYVERKRYKITSAADHTFVDLNSGDRANGVSFYNNGSAFCEKPIDESIMLLAKRFREVGGDGAFVAINDTGSMEDRHKLADACFKLGLVPSIPPSEAAKRDVAAAAKAKLGFFKRLPVENPITNTDNEQKPDFRKSGKIK